MHEDLLRVYSPTRSEANLFMNEVSHRIPRWGLPVFKLMSGFALQHTINAKTSYTQCYVFPAPFVHSSKLKKSSGSCGW